LWQFIFSNKIVIVRLFFQVFKYCSWYIRLWILSNCVVEIRHKFSKTWFFSANWKKCFCLYLYPSKSSCFRNVSHCSMVQELFNWPKNPERFIAKFSNSTNISIFVTFFLYLSVPYFLSSTTWALFYLTICITFLLRPFWMRAGSGSSCHSANLQSVRFHAM